MRRFALIGLFGTLLSSTAAADDSVWDKYGLSPSLFYSGDIASGLSGGASRGTVYAGALHLQVAADLSRSLGLNNLTFFADGLATHGGQPSGLAGDVQGVSNISAPPDIRIYEAWLQFNVPKVPVSVLAGRYDLNTEFYALASGMVFLNSSFGVGPEFGLSGVAGPSIYPDTSLGVRVDYKPADNVVIRFAALDGVPVDRPNHQWGLFESRDGVLLIGEVAVLTRPGLNGSMRMSLGRRSNLPAYDDKFAIGGWYYTTSLPDRSLPNLQHSGSGGVYAILDRTLYSGDDDQKITGFLQAGVGDDRVNRIGGYLGLGFDASGFVPGRSSDVIGLGFAVARNGGHFKRTESAATATETTIELTYRASVTNWLTLHPDIQYIVHPNTSDMLHNALMLQFQLEASL